MPGLIRRESVDAVRDLARIDDVVSGELTLVPAGSGSLKGLCPFHDEKTPSFHVRPAIGRYYCFGCGESGDAIDFVERTQGLGFTDAVERLAASFGVTLKYEGAGGSEPRHSVPRELRPRAIAANVAAAAYFQTQLLQPAAGAARKFLHERQFSRGAASAFEVGFAPMGWDNLVNHLAAMGFTQAEMLAAGLVKTRNTGNGVYDVFRGRLMFPIKDTSGVIIGFGGRRLDELEDNPNNVAKYLNTTETILYKKSQVLFGIDKARDEIRRLKQVVLVEGYTDVMACWLAGVKTAVATCGTAFGGDHAKLVRRLMGDHVAGGGLALAAGESLGGEVIFTFDGDQAGQAAALKAFGEDQRFHAQTFVAVSPDGMDPCELRITRGDAAVVDLIRNREPLFKFVVKSKLREFDLETIEGRVDALRAAAPIVAGIRDFAYRENYSKELARMLGVDVDAARAAVAAAARGGHARTSARGIAAAGAPAFGFDVLRTANPVLQTERAALAATLQSPELVSPQFDALRADTFTHPALAWLHLVIQQAGGLANAAEIGPRRWINLVAEHANPALQPLLNTLAITSLPVSDGAKLPAYIAEVVADLQIQSLDRRIAAARGRLSRAEANGSGYLETSAEIQALEAQRRALLPR